MKLSTLIFSFVFLMILSGCASRTPSITYEEMRKMSLEQFLKDEAGYKYIDAIKLYQKREKSYLRGKDGKARPDAYCSAMGGEMVRIKDALDFPDKSDYYPANKKVENLFKEKVEWVKDPEKYGLYLDNSNLRIAKYGKYCMVGKKPMFFYYPQPFRYFDGFTDIVVETSKDKMDNLKKVLYNEPLNQCLSYLNIANPMTKEWNRAIKKKKELLDKKETIQKRENKYSKELANAVFLTPQTLKHIPLVSERLFSAISRDYNKMQVARIKAKFDLEQQAINAEYATAIKPIQDQINQIEMSLDNLKSEFEELNIQYLISLGIVQDFETWKLNLVSLGIGLDFYWEQNNKKKINNYNIQKAYNGMSYEKYFPKYKEEINNNYNIQKAYNTISQVCGSFADKKQKILEGE